MKKIMAACLAAVMLLGCLPAQAAPQDVLKSVEAAFYLEQDAIDLPAYQIGEDVFVPVQAALGYFGASVQFEAETGSLHLVFGNNENHDEIVKQFQEFVRDTGRNVRPSFHTLRYNGYDTGVAMRLINGYNFIDLEGLQDLFGYVQISIPEENRIVLTKDDLYLLYADEKEAMQAYIAKETLPVFLTADDAWSAVDFSPYRMIFMGENHAVQANFDIRFSLIKYLSENYGVRYIFEETGYPEGMLLTEYFENGDERIIDEMTAGAWGSAANNTGVYEFYKKLYAYNQTLPEERRLVVLGIDVQHNVDRGIAYVLSLLAGEDRPAIVRQAHEMLDAITSQADFYAFAAFTREHADELRDAMGEDQRHLENGIRGVEQRFAYYANGDMVTREGFIHENAARMFEEFEIDKAFGMFGYAHTRLNDYMGENMPNLAHFLNTEVPQTADKVLSIAPEYIDSYHMDPYTGEPVSLNGNNGPIFNGMIREHVTEGYALLPIRADSPFAAAGWDQQFQYLLAIVGSPAAKPYVPLT